MGHVTLTYITVLEHRDCRELQLQSTLKGGYSSISCAESSGSPNDHSPFSDYGQGDVRPGGNFKDRKVAQ
jgi:hypothetical protein